MMIIKLALAIVLMVTMLPWCGWVFTVAVRDAFAQGLPPGWAALLLGLMIGGAFAWWRRPNAFFHTWLHEHAHVIAALVLLVRPRTLHVTDGSGGGFLPDRKLDPLRRILILIAPYTLPLLLGPALIWRWFAGLGSVMFAQLAIGWLLVHHFHGLYHNVRQNFKAKDADLPRVGRPLALVLISGVGVLVLAAWFNAAWR